MLQCNWTDKKQKRSELKHKQTLQTYKNMQLNNDMLIMLQIKFKTNFFPHCVFSLSLKFYNTKSYMKNIFSIWHFYTINYGTDHFCVSK